MKKLFKRPKQLNFFAELFSAHPSDLMMQRASSENLGRPIQIIHTARELSRIGDPSRDWCGGAVHAFVVDVHGKLVTTPTASLDKEGNSIELPPKPYGWWNSNCDEDGFPFGENKLPDYREPRK